MAEGRAELAYRHTSSYTWVRSACRLSLRRELTRNPANDDDGITKNKRLIPNGGGKHQGDRGSSATSRRGAEANLTTAERFDRRSSSPTTFSGDESASVTIRPDEARVDGANDDAAVIASPSSGTRDGDERNAGG